MEDAALSEIVIVEVPEGVITGGGGVTAALPPPQPVRAKVMQRIAAERTSQSARRLLRTAGEKKGALLIKNANSKKRRVSKSGTSRGTRKIGGMRSGSDGNS